MEATLTLFADDRRFQRKVLYTVTLSYPWVLHAGIHEMWIKTIYSKKFQKFPKIKIQSYHMLSTIYISFTLY